VTKKETGSDDGDDEFRRLSNDCTNELVGSTHSPNIYVVDAGSSNGGIQDNNQVIIEVDTAKILTNT
jgi:hypothetical protein